MKMIELKLSGEFISSVSLDDFIGELVFTDSDKMYDEPNEIGIKFMILGGYTNHVESIVLHTSQDLVKVSVEWITAETAGSQVMLTGAISLYAPFVNENAVEFEDAKQLILKVKDALKKQFFDNLYEEGDFIIR